MATRLPSISAGLDASTVTPGRMPPVLSVTSPVSVLLVWANATPGASARAASATTAVQERLITVSSSNADATTKGAAGPQPTPAANRSRAVNYATARMSSRVQARTVPPAAHARRGSRTLANHSPTKSCRERRDSRTGHRLSKKLGKRSKIRLGRCRHRLTPAPEKTGPGTLRRPGPRLRHFRDACCTSAATTSGCSSRTGRTGPEWWTTHGPASRRRCWCRSGSAGS